MLSLNRKSPNKLNANYHEPKYKTVDKKYFDKKADLFDFKKDLQNYIDKKEQNKPIKIGSLAKFMTMSKEPGSPINSKEEKFLFSSRDPIPLSKSKNIARHTTSQHAKYRITPVSSEKNPSSKKSSEFDTLNEAKIVSLEKLLDKLKEKQLIIGNGLRVTFDPTKKPKKSPKSQDLTHVRKTLDPNNSYFFINSFLKKDKCKKRSAKTSRKPIGNKSYYNVSAR